MTRTTNYVMTVELENGKANDEVLNLVKMLVDQIGGSIRIEREEGTRFI